MTTDTSEKGLERLICTALAGHPCDPPPAGALIELRAAYGGVGWSPGNHRDYDREYCVDLAQLAAFLHDTQPETVEALALDEDGPTRRKFLARLQGEISKRGTIEVLRHGIRHGALDLDLFYGTPSPGNEQAEARFKQNRFTVTRQLRYSRDESQRALDIGLFINGLPVFTFELKNTLTKQTVDDAVWQYKKDRNPREKLFELGRCVAHFAVDENEVRFCTHLKGKASWFLPFNRGWKDGAGNPPNPSGIKTDYLWRQVLTRKSLTKILENYAQLVESRDEKTGRKTRTQVWPRYHQLEVVRRLLVDAWLRGVGRRYLIQHSAGSGKSNSIAWLAHQLIGLAKDGAPVFDSIIVVTDGASSISRSATPSSSTPRSARRWVMPSTPATCAASSSPARKSSFRQSRSSRSSSMRSATSSAGGASPSSSTRPIPARAAAPARRWRRRSPRPVRRGMTRPSRTRSTG